MSIAPKHKRARPSSRGALMAVLLSSLAGCGGAGPYNYARTYEPLISERGHLERAQEIPYERVKSVPHDYKETELAWFGVVSAAHDLPDGRAQLKLAARTHQARHLCRDEYQDSCRLTVSESSPGEFTVRVALKPDEKQGKERVWVGSLLKVYGKPTGESDEQGDPVIEPAYYRHWPRGYYVTTAQRGAMKR